jgi:predicted MPP superfamily phosphohydrolase
MFIIFITIASAVYFGLHFFVYKSLVRSLLQDAPTWKRIIKWLFWFSGVSFLAAQLLSRLLKIYLLNYYAFVWMGVIAISFSIFLVQRLLALIFSTHAKPLALGALAVIGIISLISLINGLQFPGVKRVTIPMKNLPRQLSGFSIVQLSDVHLEAYSSKKRLGRIVDKINSLKPDLVVITGDLIDGNICEEPTFCTKLKRLDAAHGVLAITGNHEFYAGLDIFNEMAKLSNIKILRNETLTIADTLQIIGLDDTEARRFNSKGPGLDELIKTCDQNKPIILLFHRPLGFDDAAARGVDLQLSGHTHAGQIPPADIIVWIVYKYPWGLYKKGDAHIYTSSGTGLWGPPMRFLSRNEIVHFTLVKNTDINQ